MKRILIVSTFVLAATAGWQCANAQAPAPSQAASRHAAGLLMEHRGDDKGAFVAFLEAAEAGYPPAQRRLGEIYDSGNSAVQRDFPESIRWYEKARLAGEDIPSPKSPIPEFIKAR
jgi:TPR repeat protein